MSLDPMTLNLDDQPLLQPKSIKEMQVDIDQEIMQCHARILELKRQRNALSPLYRIPIEVLALVVEQLQLLEPPRETHITMPRDFDGEFHCFQRNSSWTRAALACRRLFDAVCSTPRLWTQVKNGVNHGLARAGCHPLELNYTYKWKKRGNKMKDLVERTHALMMTFDGGYEFEDSLRQLGSFTPLLTTMKLYNNAGAVVRLYSSRDFTKFSDQLVELDIMYLNFDEDTWTSNDWPQLKRLRLEGVDIDHCDIITMLQCMPNLTTLSLVDALSLSNEDHVDPDPVDRETVETSDNDTRRDLTRLEKVHVGDTPLNVFRLLRNLESCIPPSHQMALRIISDLKSGGFGAEPQDLFNLIDYLLRDSRWGPIWHGAGLTAVATEIVGTLIWRADSGTRPQHVAKFVSVSGGAMESVLEIPYLMQDAAAYTAHSVRFTELVIAGPLQYKERRERDLLMSDLDELIQHHAPRLEYIVVSQSTAQLPGFADWLKARIDENRFLHVRTYFD
jgi:hypothetical protein